MYNEVFDDEEKIEEEFKNILSLITELNIDSKRIFQKADFFTLFVELYFARFVANSEVDKITLGKELKRFYDDVDSFNEETVVDNDYISDVKLYKDNIIQGTNHRSSRISRGKVLAKIIECAKV